MSYSYGSWSVTLTASSYTISNTGGSVTLYPSASRDRYSNYTSGYTVRDGYDTADPSLSTNGISGFTLSGTTLTASSNSSTSSRTVRVFANYDGASDYVDITQGGASVSYKYYLAFTSPTGSRTTSRTGLSALGGNNFTVDVAYSFKTKVINGSEISTRYPLALPAPNIEIAQEVANKAQVLINQFGYYQFLKLVDFMQKNPGAVSFGLNLINRK